MDGGIIKLLTVNFLMIGTLIDLLRISADCYDVKIKGTDAVKMNTIMRGEYKPPKVQNYTDYTESNYDTGLEFSEEEERDADFLYMRVERVINEKIERAENKNIISSEEAKKLTKEIEKEMKKQDVEYWVDSKGQKTFDICLDLLENNDMLETLEKIKKA